MVNILMVQHFWEEHGGRYQEVIMRVLSRHIKALERQVHESVLIEKESGEEKVCLNLKSEWAGSKIPGLRVFNPKGLGSNKVGGEVEEEEYVLEGRRLYKEALRRGSKRLAYRNEDFEGQEDDVCPRVKRPREEGNLGSGWDHITPERSPDPRKDKDFKR